MKYSFFAIFAAVVAITSAAATDAEVAQPKYGMTRRGVKNDVKGLFNHQHGACDQMACEEDHECAAENCGSCERVGPRAPGRKVCSG